MKIKKDGNINVQKEKGETFEKNGEETMVRIKETLVNVEELIVNVEETMVNIEESRGEVVERLINDEYKYWKSQTPFLYDLVISHAIEWPSLTIEWLPDRVESSDGSYSVQKLILGTHATDGEPNYLNIVQVKLPILDDREYDEYSNLDDSKDDRSQLESGAVCKVQIIQQIHHDGEVARARHMPQDPCIIATKTIKSEVHIFNYKNHPAKPSLGGTSNPDLRLTGHTNDGFGLSWSTVNQGLLLSSSDDSEICLWDINQNPLDKAMDALQSFTAHKGPVEDVAWHLKHGYLFASCGSDRYLHIYDFRSPCHTRPIQRLMAHQSEINCLSFNPINEFHVATGSTDKAVKSFDLRKFTSPLHTFSHHNDGVVQIGWSPFNPAVLASSCAGRRLMVWDTRSTCFVQDTQPQITKLKSLKCGFLGYSRLQKGYKCYSPTLHRYVASRDVTFHEDLPFFPVFSSHSQRESDDLLAYITPYSDLVTSSPTSPSIPESEQPLEPKSSANPLTHHPEQNAPVFQVYHRLYPNRENIDHVAPIMDTDPVPTSSLTDPSSDAPRMHLLNLMYLLLFGKDWSGTVVRGCRGWPTRAALYPQWPYR